MAAYYGICQDTESMASPSMDIYLISYGNTELKFPTQMKGRCNSDSDVVICWLPSIICCLVMDMLNAL